MDIRFTTKSKILRIGNSAIKADSIIYIEFLQNFRNEKSITSTLFFKTLNNEMVVHFEYPNTIDSVGKINKTLQKVFHVLDSYFNNTFRIIGNRIINISQIEMVGDGGRTLHFTNGHAISVNENRKMFEYANNESLEGVVFECITDRNYMPNTPFLKVIK